VPPGLPSASELEPGRLRSHDDGRTMSFRVSPPQPIYSAAQTVSGVTRPHRTVNLWRSAPGLPLPQTLELRWRETREIGTIELTFPGHLLQDHNRYPAYYREPDCPRDYRIEAWTAGGWESVHETFGNYQRRVSHRLSRPVRTERIRIVFLASNGGAEAAVYEIRCYGI